MFMRTRIVLLALSLITAAMPSWANACGMAAQFSPCHHNVTQQMSPSGGCCADGQTDTRTKHGAPNGAGCAMATVCALASGAAPSYCALHDAFLAPAFVIVSPAKHFISADASLPFRPPIA